MLFLVTWSITQIVNKIYKLDTKITTYIPLLLNIYEY